jgi:uncharacterized membrane protein YraQ (UPF0718 family)
MIETLLRETLQNLWSYLPILLAALFVSNVIQSRRSARVFDYFLHGRVRETLLAVTLTGLLTPGPLAAYLPVLKALRKLGFRLSLIAAFVTSQTLVGPGRLFMEVRYFGAPFFVYRVLASFAIALAVGAVYALLERRQAL